MKTKKLSLVALIAGIVALAFNACEEKNPIFYPSEERSENLFTPPDNEGPDTTDPSDTTEPETQDVFVMVQADQGQIYENAPVEITDANSNVILSVDSTSQKREQCSNNFSAAFRDLEQYGTSEFVFITYFRRASDQEYYTDTSSVRHINNLNGRCITLQPEKVE